jgi:hypothetical protein
MSDPCPVPEREPPCQLNSCTTDPPTPPDFDCPTGCELGPCSPVDRADLALQVRNAAAQEAYHPRSHPCNCDELSFQSDPEFTNRWIASYTKGLPHDPVTGEVDATAYCELLQALATGDPGQFEEVPIGCCAECDPPDPTPRQLAECRIMRRQLANPQAAFAFNLQGADSHALCMPPAPAFSSAEEIAEIAEEYWMALARDIPFTQYAADPLINAAASDLALYQCQFAPTAAPVLFRGFNPGSQVGPYVSQFLYIDTPFGASFIPARIRTLQPRIDYMTGFNDWLAVQDGCNREQSFCDDTFRFIRNGRDLAQYVHVDLTFNAFMQAGLTLAASREPLRRCQARPGLGVDFARCLPYVNPEAPFEEQFRGKSRNQYGFVTFGQPHLFELLLEAMELALRAVWYQKWSVHRRLRPEEFAGRIDRQLFAGVATYPFHPGNLAQLQLDILPRILQHSAIQNQNRRRPPEAPSYLLPQAFAEGSPTHPSYGSGHSTVAGACGTILKAFFSGEQQYILNPVVPTDDGLALTAFDPGGDTFLTVEGEINKLVDNIGLGRNLAGVHWRSDHQQAILLGEEVAIRLLCEQRNTYNEEYEFRLNKFDGTMIRIRPGIGVDCPGVITGEPDPALPCARTRTPYLCEVALAAVPPSRAPEQGEL